MSATSRHYILFCLIALLHQTLCYTNYYAPTLLEDLDESTILNLLIADKGSVILFYTAIEGASPPPIMEEYNKLAKMVESSGLEIDLFYHPIEATSPMIQSLKLKELPSIKLIVNGKSYEYAGKKTAATLFQDIERQFFKTVLKVSSQKKLQSLLNGERGLVVYFDNDSRDPAFHNVPDISLVRRVFETQVSSWNDYYLFVIAKDVKTVEQFGDFEGKNGDIVVFRRHYPFHILYTEEVDPQFFSMFLKKNTLPKINMFDDKLHNFIKDKRVACLLLVAKPKDKDIEQVLVEAREEIGEDILLAVYYDDNEVFMRRKLQRLIGSSAPFTESQIFIIDHRTGTFKFYKMEKSITKDNVVQYYGYWKDNLLKALLRSELLPTVRPEDSIERLVGRNYKQRVMVPAYDAYVFFYFEGCGQTCDRILGVLQDVASQMRNFRVLKFFKIDLALNDIPDLQLEYLPAFGVYLRDDKVLRVYQEEKISHKKMLKFINEWSKLLTKEEYEALEKESEEHEFDRLIGNLQNKKQESYGDL